MDWTQLVIEFVKLIFYVATVAIGSGVITSIVTQALKWKAIKIPAQKYPTIVAAILSFVVAVPAVILTGLVEVVGWVSYLVIALASLLVATQTYDQIKNAIEQIKAGKE